MHGKQKTANSPRGNSPGAVLGKSYIGIWCNGSTTVFGAVGPGSNPGIPTHIEIEQRLDGSNPPATIFESCCSLTVRALFYKNSEGSRLLDAQ